MKKERNKICRRIIGIHPHDAFHTTKDIRRFLYQECLKEHVANSILEEGWLTGSVRIPNEEELYFYGIKIELRRANGRKP